jgi:hypothetical protein
MDRPLTRRRTREQDVDEDDLAKLDDDLDDEMVEEDEVTRCVCGYQEYPGPPSDATKSLEGDDLSGLFIQCDICKVWQHGGCVGIMDEAASPEEYFCEECRKDLHKVTTSPKGYVRLATTTTLSGTYTTSNDMLIYPALVKSILDTFPSTTSSTAERPASHPSPKRQCPHQANGILTATTAMREPVSTHLASVAPQ